jgi:hypothetical protein
MVRIDSVSEDLPCTKDYLSRVLGFGLPCFVSGDLRIADVAHTVYH